jgi:GTPase SAR1 family protein
LPATEAYIVELRKHVPEKEVMIVLVGNKIDLESKRRISKREGQDFAKRLRIPLFFEVTSRKSEMVDCVVLTGVKAAHEICKYGYSLNHINLRYNEGSWNQRDQFFELNLRKLTNSAILSDIVINHS